MEWNFIRPKKKRRKKVALCDLIGYMDYEIHTDYVPTKYFDAFNIFFRLENVLRIFVYSVLKAKYGMDWIDFQLGNNSASKISALFKQRIGKPKKYEYIGKVSENPIMYMTLGELFSIMYKEKELFARYFKGSLEALKEKFNELAITRNNLAHFREITKKDLNRVKMIVEDLSPSFTPFFKDLFPEDENFSDFNFKENKELLKNWRYLIENLKHLRLFLLINKNKTQIKLQVGVFTKTLKVKPSDKLEVFDIVEYPIIIDYINVDFIELYKRIKVILPYITHLTYTSKMAPLEEKKGEYKGKYRSGKMSDFGIFFYSEFNQFMNNYESLFISLKSVLDDIEKDFEKHEEYNKHVFEILKKHECHISGDLTDYEAPFELPKELYIEDWNHASFGDQDFLDIRRSPWLKESVYCLGLE